MTCTTINFLEDQSPFRVLDLLILTEEVKFQFEPHKLPPCYTIGLLQRKQSTSLIIKHGTEMGKWTSRLYIVRPECRCAGIGGGIYVFHSWNFNCGHSNSTLTAMDVEIPP